MVVVSRSAERVYAAVDAIRERRWLIGGRLVAADLTDGCTDGRVVEKTRSLFGQSRDCRRQRRRSAGHAAVSASADDLTAACELLLLPVQRLVELTLPAMRAAGWGRFVAITSIAVREPQPGLVLSNALRAAVTGYLKSDVRRGRCDGVTVNTVCPGFTATDRLGVLAANVAQRDGSTVEEVFAGWAAHGAGRSPARARRGCCSCRFPVF